MLKNAFIIALAVGGLSIASNGAFGQLPAAGSAGAGSAAVSGVPIGPGSVGGTNNSVNDPSGIGNAARMPPPNVGGANGPATSLAPPSAGLPASRRTVVPSRRIDARKLSPAQREIAIKENDRLLSRKLKSICKGC